MPKKFIEIKDALLREGYSSNSAYAIATTQYRKMTGHNPRLHVKNKGMI